MPEEHNDDVQPEFVIEGARSARSRCKTCRRKIAKGGLRIGVLIEGPFGVGYLWHHLNCLARNRLHLVEQAYDNEAWQFAKEPPKKLPKIEALRKLGDKAAQQKKEKQDLPFAEIAPSGRSKCKQCDQAIAEGAIRLVVGREVAFGQQVRTAPVKIHPACAREESERPDSTIELEQLKQALLANSKHIEAAQLEAACSEFSS